MAEKEQNVCQRPQLPKVVPAGEINPYKPVDHNSKVKSWLEKSCFWDFYPDYFVDNFEKNLSKQQLLEMMHMYQEATEKCKLDDKLHDAEVLPKTVESSKDSDCSSSVQYGTVGVSQVTDGSWVEDSEAQVQDTSIHMPADDSELEDDNDV